MPEAESPPLDTTGILRREADRLRARYQTRALSPPYSVFGYPAFDPLGAVPFSGVNVRWEDNTHSYAVVREEPSPATIPDPPAPVNPAPVNRAYTDISWDSICDEYLSRPPAYPPAREIQPPLPAPDFPPGTRYFIWTDSDYRNPTSNVQAVFTPFEGRCFAQGFRETSSNRSFRNPDYMNEELHRSCPNWSEVTFAGFQIMMSGIRGYPHDHPELRSHFIPYPAPIVLRPRPTNHKIGVPKGRLP